MLPTGAGFEQARTPESALADLAVAIGRAIVERRPVVFNIPSDDTWQDIEYRDVPLDLPASQRIHPDPTAIRRAVDLITAARKTVMLAGHGPISARTSLLRLAERIGAPRTTSLKAKDLFRGDPFDLGIAGGLAGPVTREIIDSADLIISFGVRLNTYTTRQAGAP
ncbi:hypothetical protein D7147_04875 [Micromonospora musae]|uniref:Thiamine pyrophosphate enzyme central domain-containing protein n=1 Tax=Micromonospora musae TaxID=1894970 RepID=A0ABX9REC2_9ACTN|nr:hypothetical protein [Micromonospora musae]RKN22070.1 hypothetical protein D7147_04875 [Micromonospora musae]